jgi:two-component system alkaline phosphatase synthesis response regulator PhoP
MRKKILIIDDTKADVDLIKTELAKTGSVIHVSMTGQDGLKKARKIRPDLVLLDLILPDIDGFDVCEEIKKDKNLANTKIIIVSVKGDVEKVGKVLQIKADDYIVKTLVGEIPDDLISKVKAQLGIH